jgi:hypothetical protein
MSSTKETTSIPADEELPVPASSCAPDGPEPGAGRRKLLAELGEFFLRRRDSRGIFLPLVGIDRSE